MPISKKIKKGLHAAGHQSDFAVMCVLSRKRAPHTFLVRHTIFGKLKRRMPTKATGLIINEPSRRLSYCLLLRDRKPLERQSPHPPVRTHMHMAPQRGRLAGPMRGHHLAAGEWSDERTAWGLCGSGRFERRPLTPGAR
jgi:hypothetical protein